MIDIRSDTVTKPTAAMRAFMANAEVGDDVYREDPMVRALEEETAALLGKDAALYVPSGTMSNQIGVWVNTHEGDEVICERDCHIYNYEAGAPALLSRVLMKTLQGARGVISAAQVEEAVNPANIHAAATTLVCLENTHNKAGGTVYPREEMERISDLCKRRDMRLHLDGARLWNASAATGIPERDYAELADTVSVCFSKGLGAPVGSALCGAQEVIERARRKRKILGGGMRQAGIIAAGALYALRNHRARLVEDHMNARRLAEAINELPGIKVDLEGVQTNIVMIEITGNATAQQVSAMMKDEGVLINAMRPKVLRAVTHLDVSPRDIQKAIEAFARISRRIRS
ncbi:MAG TPA: low-specificity L-threonine aldolase [Candidatus Latescibacteria bacterium]|nr:low-specificity L-threonine aldolase [Candidatus Latescibacterota bacterium]HOS65161.1 low-specificity L-threonine aldolase [Candidatus Latescibacterota bacterium]HPK74263.1 low-specificity L-threonine aldolase [Candidatus Latescibacterota bacterium]